MGDGKLEITTKWGETGTFTYYVSTPKKAAVDQLPQSKKAKAQYQKLNDWRNKRKRWK